MKLYKSLAFSSLTVLFFCSISVLRGQGRMVPIEDPKFEQTLLDLSIDRGALDGKVSIDAIKEITTLNIASREIESLKGIEFFESLESIDCSSNLLTQIDLSKNTNLKALICDNNALTGIDLSKNIALETLSLKSNKIEILDLGGLKKLKRLYVQENQIYQLDLKDNIALEYAYLFSNSLKSLDLTQNKLLKTLLVNSNNLTYINLQNGENKSLYVFNVTENPNLFCVLVDSYAIAKKQLQWKKDSVASYSQYDCKMVVVKDRNFEKALIQKGYDSELNGHVFLSVIDTVNKLTLSSRRIKDLSGIEGFKSLEILDVRNNYISDINLTKQQSLKKLNLSRNNLETIDLSSSTQLTNLNLSDNKIFDINLEKNKKLEFLNLSSNNLLQLDFSQNTFLKKAVNLSKNPSLKCVLVSEETLQYTKSWRANKKLSYVRKPCKLIEIEDPNFEKALIYLGYDVGKPNGTVLESNILGITSLDVSDREISSLSGISSFKSLTDLKCSNNLIESLDLSENTTLENVDASYNKLSDVNISGLESLVSLNVGNNNIKALNVSSANSLNTLNCSSNTLVDLDLTNNTYLSTLFSQNNSLVNLNLQNGSNDILTKVDITSNSNLECVWVDDPSMKSLKFWEKDAFSSYGINCDKVEIKDPNFERALVRLGLDSRVDGYVLFSRIEYLKNLNVKNRNISDLTGISSFKELQFLNASGNNLTEVDISKNKNLVEVDLSRNNLQSLDVSADKNLEKLLCRGNDLKSLDLKKQSYYLRVLDIRSNPSLGCVLVDDFSDIRKSWKKDAASVFVNQCQYVDIADARFEKALISLGFDTQLDGRIYKGFTQPKHLNLSDKRISDFSGLEIFTELEELNISENNATHIDISAFKKLKKLNFSKNQISEFIIPEDLVLEFLDCSGNNLTSIDLRGDRGKITKANFNSNSSLKCIIVDDPNRVPSSWKKSGSSVYTSDCNFVEIPDSNFEKALVDLGVDGSGVDGRLYNGHKQPNSLDLSGRDIKDISGIEVFEELKSLNISNNPSLNFDPSKFQHITDLDISNNGLSNFEASSNPNLERLNLSGNSISYIDFSKNTNLKELSLSQNNTLDSIYISKSKKLEVLHLAQTSIKKLNLKGLDVKELNLSNSFNLECVLVSSLEQTERLGWQYDQMLLFSQTKCVFTKIPDANFEQALIDLGYDSGKINKHVLTENIEFLERLDIPNKKIANLKGIEDFTSLKELNVSGNKLTNIDLTSNKNLEILNVSNNQLTDINLSVNNKLNVLNVYRNKLTSLDISHNYQLEQLYCYENQLGSLDLKANTKLKYLYGYSNAISSLDLSGNPFIIRLLVQDNSLSMLNIKNDNISRISTLNTSGNRDLYCILVNDIDKAKKMPSWTKDRLTSYTEKACETITIADSNFERALIGMGIDQGQPDGFVKTSNVIRLISLDISRKEIKDLSGIEFFKSLKYLNVSENDIADLDLSSNVDLQSLVAVKSNIEKLNISNNPNLRELNVSDNKLEFINLLKVPYLQKLDINNNKLSVLNLSKTPHLKELNIENNTLEYIDLSSNLELESIDLKNNELFSVKVDNTHNDKIINFDATENDYLSCILVDDIDFVEANSRWKKDSSASYGSGKYGFCEYINILDVNFENALVDLKLDDKQDGKLFVKSVLEVTDLDLSDKGIKNLVGIQVFKNLETLNCSSNQLEKLSLSLNTKLRSLDASNNSLQKINLSKNKALINLNISINQLQSVNLLAAENLQVLDAQSNNLESLDLSKNSKLKQINLKQNNLTSIDLQNYNNQSIKEFDMTLNQDLFCVLVDFPKEADRYPWKRDDQTIYNTNSCDVIQIPDASFERGLISLNIDTGEIDGEVMTSRALAVKTLDVSGRMIKTLKGIEGFENLEELDASSNALTSVDISANKKLKTLILSRNNLIDLDISKNIEIINLDASKNKLSSVDLSTATALEVLNLSQNKLESVDTENNINLRELYIDENSLSDIYLNRNKKLTKVSSKVNLLRSVSLKNENNIAITSFDVTENPDLYCIQIDEMAKGQSPDKRKGWEKDKTAVYTTSKCYTLVSDANFEKALSSYDDTMGDGRIPTLRIKGLKRLDISSKNIKDLSGIEDFVSLEYLNASDNNLQSVDVSAFKNLKFLDLSKNRLSQVDMSANKNLERLFLSNNTLSTLNLEQNSRLISLDCSANKLELLDMSKNKALEVLDCSRNVLNTLNIQNSTATINTLNATQNPYLMCIQADEQRLDSDISRWKKDRLAGYSVDNCNVTKISDPALESELISMELDTNLDGYVLTYSLSKIKELDVSSKGIQTLEGIEDMINIEKLNASNNKISDLDLSENKALEYVNVSKNNLTSLNIQNGNNKGIVVFNSQSNPDLQCIVVDNFISLKNNSDWSKDDASIFVGKPNCSFTEIPSVSLEKALISLGYDSGAIDGRVVLGNIEEAVRLDIPSKNISDLTGIEHFKALKILNISKNKVKDLDISKNEKLEVLNCAENSIEELDLSNNSNLIKLYCESNKIKSLDLSNNTNIEELYCFNNGISSLDFTNNKKIRFIYAYSNKLESLNLKQNKRLDRLFVKSNNLQYLNVKNGFNQNITTLDARANPTLGCIEVDDNKESETYKGWKKDSNTSYSEACEKSL